MKFFKRALEKIHNKVFASFNVKQDSILMLSGLHYMQNLLANDKVKKITDAEFKVYSQWGEDGIIAFLVSKLNIKNKVFIEFGVEDYTESNTRFLLKQFNWSGLVIDGSKENIEYINNDEIMWRYNLSTLQAFINKDNINELISAYTSEKDIGLLSIDIDGNDFWVWKAINVINPRIVICEYNNLFGGDLSLTIPYDSSFVRNKSHYSNLYFGASISALKGLAVEKGYVYIGSNSSGCNAFFVRKDLVSQLPIEVNNNFVKSNVRESRDKKGKLNYIDKSQQLNEIKDMSLLDIESNSIKKISEIFSLKNIR